MKGVELCKSAGIIICAMPGKTKAANKKQEFQLAFQGLRKILKPYDKKLRVIKDGPGEYVSESKSIR
jgi:hypothetical protein